jgi:hypothetical protein
MINTAISSQVNVFGSTTNARALQAHDGRGLRDIPHDSEPEADGAASRVPPQES